MPLPTEPVNLSVEQLKELNQKISTLRHDVNNNLSLMMAATELIRRRPESAERMWTALTEQPHKVAEVVAQFSRELEKALGITRP
jgi:aspartokinase